VGCPSALSLGGRDEFEVSDWNESETSGTSPTVEQALRLLARLLVRAAKSATPEPAADPQNPLDVAPRPKVVSGRE
jgi:hypothetical protein